MATSTSTQYQLPTPYVQDLLTAEGAGLFPQLSQAMESPFQAYEGPRVAGFSQDELDAFEQVRGTVGQTEPFQQRAGQLMGQAQQDLVGGGQRAEDYLSQGVNQGTQAVQQALSGFGQQAGQGSQTFDQAQQMTQAGAAPITSQDIQRFQDPFQSQVIDTTMDELQRQDLIRQQGTDAAAAQAGAFGGARHGIQEAEQQRNLADVQARTLSQLLSQNYGQALSAAQQQQQQQLMGAGQLGQLGSDQARLQQGALGQMLGGGQALSGIFSGAAGQQAGISGQQASGLSALARQQLGLGSFGQETALGEAEALSRVGGQQRQQEQAALDTAFQEFQRRRQFEDPFRRTGFMADIIAGAPTGQITQTQQESVPSERDPLQNLLGLGSLGLGLYQNFAGGGSATTGSGE